MKDFLTRVAERALGTAPRIDPQAASLYAPARLPLPESPLPEMPARAVNAPRSLQPRQSDLEQGPEEKFIAPTERSQREESDVIAPDRSRKSDQSPVLTMQASPANDPDSEPEIGAETSLVSSTPRDSGSYLKPAFSSDYASNVEHKVAGAEVPDRRSEIVDRREENFPARSLSFALNGTTPAVKREGPRSLPQSATPKITETLVDQSDKIVESVEFSANPSQDVPAVETAPPKVSQLREPEETTRAEPHITRAALPQPAARPTATMEPPVYERPEHSERNIHVRIGRVEVTAPPVPLAPVEPPAAPVPKLSLAEFLRQHNRRRE